ncbi:hypothetical protein SAMN05661096_01293 [Marivirga sericea]|jgi:hypothetical protein|uniref:Uncharacterized protein n=1 Tax=Marivirga sericea TaxID=1028 RepID=A0A1X7J716_9BACT|nr:hypothetical protein [Marivirga sericea]SMG22744.1 hypothetical protein SAMN05661096_01293 [Marivirga sericea]|tara:strand:+ start:19690 stop:19905 length:216 start_codon:yes stop_codon:yes gene_type:complete
MDKYNEKRLRIMEILNQRQGYLSKIENGLEDLSKDVKLLKKDFKDGLASLAKSISDSEILKSTNDKKFDKK